MASLLRRLWNDDFGYIFNEFPFPPPFDHRIGCCSAWFVSMGSKSEAQVGKIRIHLTIKWSCVCRNQNENLSKKNYTIWDLSIILKSHRYPTWGSLVERAESVMLLFIVLYRIELASLTFLSQFIFCRVTHSGSSHKSNSFEIDTHVTDQSWCSAISSLFVSLSLRSWKATNFIFSPLTTMVYP